MKAVKFIVGKTNTGYSAISEVQDKGIAVTTSDTIAELKVNALESYNMLMEELNLKQVSAEHITLVYDLPQFFDYYKVINITAFAERIGINRTLLNQYKNGDKVASQTQTSKILKGIKDLGKELYEADFA